MKQTNQYDVAIIGSGIAGSTLGAILARQGLDVAIIEARQHPRFAIGESMILETSELMRALAELYDVPEIAWFSSENYLPRAGSTHGVKRHFGYLHQQAGAQLHNPARTLQAVIPREPYGHELHIYRQDSDYVMMTSAIRYGADVLQNTKVASVEFGADGAILTSESGMQISADFVVDGGGFRSVISEKFGLRVEDMQTHSRALFTHMIDVEPASADADAATQYDLPFPMSEGTLHHVFDGGWLWVIPFNNHKQSTNPLVSVGLMLDPRKFPLDKSVSPQEEFDAFLERFPPIAKQFANAKPVRAWTRTGRLQYRSRQIAGDRWALLGHAAGFVDPLYSKGLYVSLTSVALLADSLINAKETGHYHRRQLRHYESTVRNYLAANDRLVANSYKSFAHYDLWQVYSVLWLLGAYTEYLMLTSMRARAGSSRLAYMGFLQEMRLVGGGFAPFQAVSNQIDEIIGSVDASSERAVAKAVADCRAVFATLDWMPQPFQALLDGHTSLPKAKLRPRLLQPNRGFMNQGAYREHFFGTHSFRDMLSVFLKEKVRYSSFMAFEQRAGVASAVQQLIKG